MTAPFSFLWQSMEELTTVSRTDSSRRYRPPLSGWTRGAGHNASPRSSNTLYKRSLDGEEILEDVEEVERIRTNGHFVERRLRRKKKVLDDDLPLIADAYREFRAKNKEPGT